MGACLYDRMVGVEHLQQEIGNKTAELGALIRVTRELALDAPEPTVPPAPHMDLSKVHRHILDATDNRFLDQAKDGSVSIAERYQDFSDINAGWRRFFPRKRDEKYNERVDAFGELLGNLDHFKTRGRLALDNFVSGFVSGTVLGSGMAYALSSFIDCSPDSTLGVPRALVPLFSGGLAGLLSGLFVQTLQPTDHRFWLDRAAYLDTKVREHYFAQSAST